MDFSQDEVDFLINHLVLPPRLPQADDRDPRLERALLRLVADAAITFSSLIPKDQRPAVHLAASTIDQLIAARDENGAVSPDKVLQAMKSLTTTPMGEYLQGFPHK